MYYTLDNIFNTRLKLEDVFWKESELDLINLCVKVYRRAAENAEEAQRITKQRSRLMRLWLKASFA